MISLKSNVTKKILNYFFINPNAKHYINEFARMLHLDPKNVDTKLKELEKEGLLKSEFWGKERYFYLSKKYPLLKEYRQIVLKTVGVERRLKKLLHEIPGVKQAYLFGSYAKDTMDVSSDIDLLVIGSHSSISLHKSINKMQLEIDREINVINLTEKEFKEKKKTSDPFIKTVFSEKNIKLL